MKKWKPVKGYEGLYDVSADGEVRSTRRQGAPGGLRKLYVNQDGYHMVKLCKDGKERRWMVHRLVYEAFVSVIPDGLEINHIDENKQNNHVSNLEAISHVENVRHGTGIERMRQNHYKRVEQYTLDGELIAVYPSQKAAAEATGINRCNISWCCCGNASMAGGYIWRNAT